jgi:redox-sensitive bicupin YhaK (pirin superfamily)
MHHWPCYNPDMIRVLPREIDFAGFPVRRLMPTRELQSIGPWVFIDHMGPHTFSAGNGIDVIPHPHIGLATVTYLFEGEIIHRDTIGNVQAITPGAINLMSAGRGIAHSERTHPDKRTGTSVHGLQLWLALTEDQEESEPTFEHFEAAAIPESSIPGGIVRVMMGEAFGLSSPVTAASPTLYAEASLAGGSRLVLPDSAELCVYGISGSVQILAADGSETIEPGVLAVTGPGVEIAALDACRLVILGGSPIGTRYMWWNFVSSRIERIEQAKTDWKEGRFGAVVGDAAERAPLPESDNHSRMKA